MKSSYRPETMCDRVDKVPKAMKTRCIPFIYNTVEKKTKYGTFYIPAVDHKRGSIVYKQSK